MHRLVLYYTSTQEAQPPVLMFYTIQVHKKHNAHRLNVLYYTSTQEAQCTDLFYTIQVRKKHNHVLMFYTIQVHKKHNHHSLNVLYYSTQLTEPPRS